MSLPEFGGMDTGFNYYHGADPGEYDLVVSNSEGGLERLLELGARRAEAVFWGADPEFFAPQPVEKETDVFFYGYGDKFRREWMAGARRRAVAALPDVDFSLGGRDFHGDVGRRAPASATCRSTRSRARSRPRGSTSASRAARTRPSTRRRRAGRSSSPSAGAAIVANPYDGHRALVRARLASCIVVDDAERGDRRLPRPARRPGAGRGDGPPRARARARRAHLPPPRPAAARPARPRSRSACRLSAAAAPAGRTRRSRPSAASRSSPPSTRSATSAALLDELRALDPGLEVVVVSDGSTDRTAEVAPRARRARRRSCRSTSGSAARCRPGFRFALGERLRARRALDGDGQHDPAQLRARRRAGARRRGRPRDRLALPRRRAATARRRRGASASACSPASSPRIARQRLTDTTSGFQALNRRAIELFAADLPARLPRGRGARDGDQAPAPRRARCR